MLKKHSKTSYSNIVALINLDKSIELPFVFAGDGAFVLVPPRLLEQAKQAFVSLEKLARDTYSLEHRERINILMDIISL